MAQLDKYEELEALKRSSAKDLASIINTQSGYISINLESSQCLTAFLSEIELSLLIDNSALVGRNKLQNVSSDIMKVLSVLKSSTSEEELESELKELMWARNKISKFFNPSVKTKECLSIIINTLKQIQQNKENKMEKEDFDKICS